MAATSRRIADTHALSGKRVWLGLGQHQLQLVSELSRGVGWFGKRGESKTSWEGKQMEFKMRAGLTSALLYLNWETK